MQIDRTLNLVVPVERADGVLIYVHATPISRVSFDQNFLVIAKTFTAIYAEGLNAIAGPRVAAKLLRRVAMEMGQADVVEKGLFAEMRRLTNVMVPGDKGWQHLPLEVAQAQEMIEIEDVEEAENAIAFFMLVSAMHKRREVRGILEPASRLWGAQLTSLNAMAFTASLPTSTKAASTGAKESPSSIPS